jgi:hypothetical protein
MKQTAKEIEESKVSGREEEALCKLSRNTLIGGTITIGGNTDFPVVFVFMSKSDSCSNRDVGAHNAVS